MKKHVYKIDFAIILISLISLIGLLFLFNYSQPLVIAPSDGFVSLEKEILFEFENAGKILIDDNIEFSSYEEIFVKENLIISLEQGVYYWKIEGVFESEIRKLTIESEVNLKLKKLDDLEDSNSYGVVNAGNVRLNVDVYDESILTGKIILDIDEEEKVSGTKFIGGQSE
jgi:hypothetical protein